MGIDLGIVFVVECNHGMGKPDNSELCKLYGSPDWSRSDDYRTSSTSGRYALLLA